jgi:hypothetical protein
MGALDDNEVVAFAIMTGTVKGHRTRYLGQHAY